MHLTMSFALSTTSFASWLHQVLVDQQRDQRGATHYGGMGELYDSCISKIQCIDQMTMSCLWVQLNDNDETKLKGSGRRG